MMQTKRCNRLDDFLMKKMLNSEKNYFSDEERYQAYRNFLRLTTKEGKRIAATQTIKKWFGLDIPVFVTSKEDGKPGQARPERRL